MLILKMFVAGLLGFVLVTVFMTVTKVPQVYASLNGEFTVYAAQDTNGNWLSLQEANKLVQNGSRYRLVSVSADWTRPSSN